MNNKKIIFCLGLIVVVSLALCCLVVLTVFGILKFAPTPIDTVNTQEVVMKMHAFYKEKCGINPQVGTSAIHQPKDPKNVTNVIAEGSVYLGSKQIERGKFNFSLIPGTKDIDKLISINGVDIENYICNL